MKLRVKLVLALGLACQLGCGDDDVPDQKDPVGLGAGGNNVSDQNHVVEDGGPSTADAAVADSNVSGDNHVVRHSGVGQYIIGNNQRADESRALAGFVRVTSAGALDVDVQQAAAFSVTISIDANLLALVTTELRGDTLVISTTGSFETKLAGPHVRVTLPRLLSAAIEGSGDCSVATVESEEVDLRSKGSGELHFQGSAPRLVIESTGSGGMTLAGAATDLTVRSIGSGGVAASKLAATTASVDSSGSGDVAVAASGTVSTNLRGSGNIRVHGGAKLLRGEMSGSGTVMGD